MPIGELIEALTNIRTRGGGNRNVGIKHPLWHIFIQNISCVRGGGAPQQQSQQQQQQQQPPLLTISTQQRRRLWLDSGLAQQQQSLLLLWQFWLVSALHCHAPYFPAHSAEEMIIQYVCDQLSLLIMLVCMLQLKMLTERRLRLFVVGHSWFWNCRLISHLDSSNEVIFWARPACYAECLPDILMTIPRKI